MLAHLKFENILFLDIETVPRYSVYSKLPDSLKKLWDNKANRLLQNKEDSPADLYHRAGIYAEFGKIICISVGFLKNREFRIKSYYGDDEKILLKEFSELLGKHYNKPQHLLCAHNGKEFDFPYIARRLLINRLPLPEILNIAGKKPWEVRHLDTMELWKFGDYKNYTSLALLTEIFDIPSPKDDIDGSQVAEVYWKDQDLERIVKYCQKDTLAVVQILLCYLGKPQINPEHIVYV